MVTQAKSVLPRTLFLFAIYINLITETISLFKTGRLYTCIHVYTTFSAGLNSLQSIEQPVLFNWLAFYIAKRH